MIEYHKIQTVFHRDPDTKFKTLLVGQWAEPEFEYLQSNMWLFTEKVDGTNIRVSIDPQVEWIGYAGKTDNAQIPPPLGARLMERFAPLTEKLHEIFPDGGCLYGEGYGARIQKGGGNYRPDQDFVLFDVNVGKWWLQRTGVVDVAAKLGLDIVPTVGEGTLHDLVRLVSDGFDSGWGAFAAEGVVARPVVELTARNGSRIITKLKTKDFP